MLECIKFIKNEIKDPWLEQITYELTASLLMMVCKISKDEALQKIKEVIANGLAAEKFEMMVKALGGPTNILSSYEKDPIYATQFHPEKSQTNGLLLI